MFELLFFPVKGINIVLGSHSVFTGHHTFVRRNCFEQADPLYCVLKIVILGFVCTHEHFPL